MENLWKILTGITLGALIVFIILYFEQGCRLEKKITLITSERDDCRNSPSHADTIWDSIYLQGGTLIKPVPFKVIIHDTIKVLLKESFYDSVYRGNGWRFRYKIKTLGELDGIVFSDFVSPKEIIRITQKIDTCISKEPEYKAKGHWWIYWKPKVIFAPFKVTDVTIGAFYTYKDKWGIGLGGGYDWNIKTPVIEGTFLFNLK
jgi:hypothetical protein